MLVSSQDMIEGHQICLMPPRMKQDTTSIEIKTVKSQTYMLTVMSQLSMGRGWQKGIKSDVRLTAMVPATTAVANTGPLAP
jgi:hypothetical protein